jgi:hypothetical protein
MEACVGALRRPEAPRGFERTSHFASRRPDWLAGAAGFETPHQNRPVRNLPPDAMALYLAGYLKVPSAHIPGGSEASAGNPA